MKDKMMNGILMVAEKLQTNKYMSAIKNAFTALLPIIITGAFCTLISNVVLSTSTSGISLAKVQGFGWLEILNPIFTAANYATLNFMAIGLVILISIELGKHYGKTETVLPVVALACYIALCSTTVSGTVADAAGNDIAYTVVNVLPRNFTNAQGLFMAMFASIIGTELYVKIVDSGKLDISMPETVPANVAKAFNVLFPSIATIIIVATFGFIFEMIFGYTFFEAIAKWIQAPLSNILTGLPGYLFLFWMTTLLWVLGIHGTQVLGPVYQASMLIALDENLAAVTLGEKAPNILNYTFISMFSTVTGAGITGGLIISILILSKREDYKAIAKLSVAPGLFNINETMTFGLPIVLNPVLAIPFMISPIVSATIGYTLTRIGFCEVMSYNVPWTTPPLLGPFLATGGDVKASIAQLLAILASALVYAPFVLISNKQAEIEAQALQQEA
ncbi:MAG: PTS sugar transporter subunit IIC [Erysipelotrichaceae bacterium]|nr:PTS sugar transporter subunit IIC [Erysipelotrichaceae bacterium]